MLAFDSKHFALVVAASIAAIAFACSPRTNTERQLSIVVRTDDLDVLPGSRVTLTQGDRRWELACDRAGQTPAVSITDDGELAIVLHELRSGETQSLATKLIVDPSDLPRGADQLTLHCLQPTLQNQLVLHGRETYGPVHDLWVLSTPPSSGMDFEVRMHVGLLARADDCAEYFEYHGANDDGTKPAAAVVIRTAATTLPDPGFWLVLDCARLRIANPKSLSAEWLLVARTESDAATGALDVHVESIDGDHARIRVRGTLGTGDNVIALTHGTRAATPRRIVSQAVPRSSGADEAGAPFCMPEAPRPPRDWWPKRREAAECFGDAEARGAKLYGSNVRTVTTRLGGVLCGEPGDERRSRTASVYRGTCLVHIQRDDGSFDAPGTTLELALEDEESRFTFPAGGRCVANFRHEAHRLQTWRLAGDAFVVDAAGGLRVKRGEAERYTRTISLEFSGTSSTDCTQH
ncbi:MAG: hypothetical protein ACKVWV_19865 [Planctomycetota bacterium]